MLALRLSARKSETWKNLWLCSVERVDEYEKVVCPRQYFQKKNSKYEILNHLYFGPNFNLGRSALGCFSPCYFWIFCRRLTIVCDIFTQPFPHTPSISPTPFPPSYHKEASYGPVTVGRLHFIRSNINTLLKETDELRETVKASNATGVEVTEPEQHNSINNREISIEEYNIIRLDQNRKGGGVICYVSNKIC